MSVPTVVIAEDEPLVRRELREMLAHLWPDLTVLAEAADGFEALTALERFHPDILFLDIHMPGLNGLEVAGRLHAGAHVVFVTAFDRYAVAAFEQGAVDYVLKPISPTRLRLTVERLRTKLCEPPADLSEIALLLKDIASAGSRYLKWLTVPDHSELKVLAVSQ
ncbi:MAG: LytR/AlgR family response regulator transcription factor [Steroidobacteraceae bacterium]